MDVDMIQSSTEGHMDMMTMMMQMEKFPEFCERFQNSSTLPEINFSSGTSSSSILPTPPIYPNPNVYSFNTLMTMPSTLSFIRNNLVQEHMTPLLQPNNIAISNKFKYPTPFNNANSYPSSADKKNSMEAIREMVFCIAVMQPIHINPKSIKPPKRRNVKISKDP
ncbi:hypothetical protein CRYUN_Cryun24cG0064200 [Craigia yunnanensis]